MREIVFADGISCVVEACDHMAKNGYVSLDTPTPMDVMIWLLVTNSRSGPISLRTETIPLGGCHNRFRPESVWSDQMFWVSGNSSRRPHMKHSLLGMRPLWLSSLKARLSFRAPLRELLLP
jgi:hypothetical protein